MAYKFLTQSLEQGRYEPEGIYLTLPLRGPCKVIQAWGDHDTYYGAFSYNGIPLKGHNGVDFGVTIATAVVAVDNGRVMEIGLELNGYGSYIKIEHGWGESFYANLGQIIVDSGQLIERGSQLATTAVSQSAHGQPPLQSTYLHFGLRIRPYNRFDGWGGFVDPLPYLDPTDLTFMHNEIISAGEVDGTVHPMVVEGERMRRP